MNVEDIKDKILYRIEKYTAWQNVDLYENIDNEIQEKKNKYKSILLTDSNIINSPIQLNLEVELPIMELYFDNQHFVLFTTLQIYSNMHSNLSKAKYVDVIEINQNSLDNFVQKRRMMKKFVDLKMDMLDKSLFEFTIEVGIPFSAFMQIYVILKTT